jgi:hypothetical protein
MVFLKQNNVHILSTECDVNLLLEETVLDGQDSDGESQKDDDLLNVSASGAEHVPPDDEEIAGDPSDSQQSNTGNHESPPQ